MKMIRYIGLSLMTIACQDKESDSGQDTSDQEVEVDSGDDTGVEETTPIEAGSFDVHIPSNAGGETGIALRIFHPGESSLRYADRSPIVLAVPGGWKTGTFNQAGVDQDAARHGYIYVQMLLPGGQAVGIESGGEADRRGAMSQLAVIDAMRFLCGQTTAVDGKKLKDHLPWADDGNLGVVGLSNGGNLALFALASTQAPQPKISWFATWESPIGDQYQTVELNDDPRYRLGECGPLSCPLTGLSDYLGYDATQSAQLTSFGNTPIDLQGVLYYDTNQNGIKDSDESIISGTPNAAPPWQIHPSTEMRRYLQDHSVDIFQGPMPTWLASISDTDAFWANRDGSSQIAQASANRPDMLVMALQTQTDHVQTQMDYPHTRANLDLWDQAGHGFIRLNPDASYLAYASQLPEDTILEYQVGTLLNYPANTQGLVPNGGPGNPPSSTIVPAAIMELADRIEAQDFSADLHQTLY